MQRVTSPGLPTSPRLMFDSRLQRAQVSFRHATWRSHEWALRAAKAVGLIILFFVLHRAWHGTIGFEPLWRIVIVLLTSVAVGPWLVFVIRRSLQGFLARRIFGSRTTAWFTTDAIAFRSRIFPNGVVIWRRWQGRPVDGRFSLTNDSEASERRALFGDRKQYDLSHFDSARILRLLVTTVTTGTPSNQVGRVNPVRSIPVTEIDDSTAERVTMVLATAAALTIPNSDPARTPDGTQGIDIDSF